MATLLDPITIDVSVLNAYYQAKAGITASNASSGSATTASAAPTNPTPPWSISSTAPRASALTQSVLAGAKFIDPGAAKLDASIPAQNSDYRNLFALYQGLNALEGLSEQAAATTTGATQKAQIQQRFAAGLAEVQSYLAGKPFGAFQLAQGQLETKAQTTAGAPVETDSYTTGSIYQGALDGEVPAFQGPTQFSLTATKASGTKVQVSFDLAELGSTPRTIFNVVSYLNTKLQAAGLSTRFADVRTPGVARTVTVGGKAVSLAAAPDQYALTIKGSSAETLSFSAPAATPAVYLTQTTGLTTGKTPDASQQLLKLNADPAGDPAAARVFAKALGPNVAAARASATAPDGSLYLLEDVTGRASDGQAIRGAQDVALTKYDSAGNLVFSRTLGSAASASGYALTVSADGSKVAVAGGVTGALDPAQPGADAVTSDSFVSVFSAKGEEQWTTRRGATAADQASGVAFGADGSVYVTGTTQSAVPGASEVGGQDGYLQGFSATGVARFATQFGTTGVDRPAGLAVDGSSVIVAGVESGHAVARRYDLAPAGAPTLGAVRDLGDLQGGEVAGVAVAADGSVVVAGSTHNGVLAAGQATTAYVSGREGFVAKLSGDLTAGAGDAVSYIGGDGSDRTLSSLTVSGGQVYVAGTTAVTPPPGQTGAADGYALAIDPATGTVGWSTRFTGQDRTVAPASIAVAQGGASVLDRLGLPGGTIDYAKATSLIANTALRPGDQFAVRVNGGAAQTVTIAADDTLTTLAAKVNRAAGFNAVVTVLPTNGAEQLSIVPANVRSDIELQAGPTGRDALGALGLAEGRVQTGPTAPITPVVGQPTANGKVYGLGLPSTLDLSTPAGAKAAQAALLTAASRVEAIYRDLINPVAAPTPAGSTGAVPAYLTAQIANYQAALSRLTGGG